VRIQLQGIDRLRDAGRDLDKLLAKDFGPAAVSDAINHTAFQARKALTAEMASVFTDPTPWTLKSIQVFQAKPKTLEAAIWINDYRASKNNAPDQWLKAEVFGGARGEKRLERALRARHILPAGKFVVPGKGARLDAYGNLSRGHAMQILSGLGAAELYAGVTANASRSRRSLAKGHARAFFVLRRGKVPIGIAERRGKRMELVLAFVDQPAYTRRLQFEDIVSRVADRELLTNLDLAIAKALS
jgi:hypothetical protein